jgi:hypothetical protein
MTRQELLDRLTQMAAEGGDMSLPVVVRISQRVVDKRRRHGSRFEYAWAALEYAPASSITLGVYAKDVGKPAFNAFDECCGFKAAELSAKLIREFQP